MTPGLHFIQKRDKGTGFLYPVFILGPAIDRDTSFGKMNSSIFIEFRSHSAF